jgi:histone acetyltransferase (RNA polymerase elongator complex component)
MGHNIDKIELLVLGGTWSEYPKEYQEEFITKLYYSANVFYDNDSHKSNHHNNRKCDDNKNSNKRNDSNKSSKNIRYNSSDNSNDCSSNNTTNTNSN